MTSNSLSLSGQKGDVIISTEDFLELRNSGYNLDQLVNGKSLFMMTVCKVCWHYPKEDPL